MRVGLASGRRIEPDSAPSLDAAARGPVHDPARLLCGPGDDRGAGGRRERRLGAGVAAAGHRRPVARGPGGRPCAAVAGRATATGPGGDSAPRRRDLPELTGTSSRCARGRLAPNV